MTEMCTAAILAGGHGRRLGGTDKAALRVGGQRIVDRQVAVLRAITDHVVIVAAQAGRYSPAGTPVWEDLAPDAGPLGGLHTALVHASTPWILAVACDLPFLHVEFLRYLVASAGDVDLVVPRTRDGYQPLCAMYARRVVDNVAARLAAGRLDMMGLVHELRVREIGPDEMAAYDPDGLLLFNVNTPEDYERAEHLASRRRT